MLLIQNFTIQGLGPIYLKIKKFLLQVTAHKDWEI